MSRADAARNRERLLTVAGELADRDGTAPALADLADAAGLGVGTVYRHFASRGELQAALATTHLRALLDRASAAASSNDPDALERLIAQTVPMLVADGNLATVFAAPDIGGDASELTAEILAAFEALVDAAHRAGTLRADLGVGDIHHLICGINTAVQLTPDRAAVERYTSVLIAGMR